MRRIVNHYKKFIGYDLPQREVVLKFQVPLPVAREKVPKIRDLYFSKMDKTEAGYEVAYLKLLQKNIRQLNRCRLGPFRRFLYAEGFLLVFYATALRHVRNYSGESGIPDAADRQEALDLVIDITRHIIESYKLIFKEIYAGGNFRFARSVSRFDISAFRILELTKFKQRVKGLRYQMLSESAWLTVNIIFHIMHASGKGDFSLPVLENISLNSNDIKRQSLCELFLSMQLIYKFNISKWPTEWQFIFDGYTQAIGVVAQLSGDDSAAMHRNASVSYCYDSRPARNTRIAEGQSRGASLLINWQNLHKKVMADFIYFFNDNNESKPQKKTSALQKFSSLSHAEGLALVQLQLESIKNEAQQQSSEVTDGALCDMRIFIGFKGIYPFLHHLHYGNEREEIGSRMVDLLAQRSAVFAEDHVSTTASAWHLLCQDEKKLTLQTQETQFTSPMKIGALLAYGFGADGIQQPKLGVVSRIFRPSEKSVFVDIDRIGQNSEPVLATSELGCYAHFDQHREDVIYAILTIEPGGEMRLLFPPHSPYLENHHLVLKRVKGQQLITLGKLQSVTKSYLCFKFVVQK
jgi:hypothetical protein